MSHEGEQSLSQGRQPTDRQRIEQTVTSLSKILDGPPETGHFRAIIYISSDDVDSDGNPVKKVSFKTNEGLVEEFIVRPQETSGTSEG